MNKASRFCKLKEDFVEDIINIILPLPEAGGPHRMIFGGSRLGGPSFALNLLKLLPAFILTCFGSSLSNQA